MKARRQNAVSPKGRRQAKNPKPEKVCPVCDRPFLWRARWKNNWDEIVYCSRRCSGERSRRRDRA
ncbi:DUF2256 domain-containing protein [Congregibacter litoralis]|uniref:DUF2256 domain-containing protein n=1 Tax=Congregibacter litoralis KT71 TaxID=314285 RepID=V7HVL7_9GAMM|nr:DUF2256 domain-containing protein [Congregibacter litoralis]ESZ89395.1 hypothetical protein KT71_001002 [Congregibacter litoralis KT71]